jgi:hypothetical protein
MRDRRRRTTNGDARERAFEAPGRVPSTRARSSARSSQLRLRIATCADREPEGISAFHEMLLLLPG